ncbi:hypothetical protein GCM10011344_19710 [Dokdonia pacifica]|nr:hypothetical protein GCM10011344_19710 [Dokdonia pacifica]
MKYIKQSMMRTTKYILVTIGVLGMMSSIYLAVIHNEVTTNIASFIASLSLVYLGIYKVVDPKTTACPVEEEKTKDFF